MNDFNDEEALARLRAADPAQGAHPDLHKISERLRGRTPLSGGPGNRGQHGNGFSPTSDTAVRVHDPGVRTGRGGLLVAASVAALALAGGGYAVGANLAGGEDETGGTAAATQSAETSDDQTGADGDAAGDALLTTEENSGSAQNESYDGGGDSGGGGYYGPVVPVAGSGLPTERTTGPVFAPVSGDNTGAAELLAEYAEELGIEGSLQDYETSADVTDSTDGRSLHVYLQGGVQSLDYSNPAIDSWCAQSMVDAREQGYSPFGEGGPQEIECVSLGELPGEDEAINAVQEHLDQVGVDYSGYEFRIDPMHAEPLDHSEGDEASATAGPDTLDEYNEMVGSGKEPMEVSVVASATDSPVGDFHNWSFSVTSAGVAYASVQLADLVELGDYPVISAVEAVERANDPRFQQVGAYIPDLEYDAMYSDEEWEEPKTLPGIDPGGQVPFPVGEATIREADLHTGIMSMWEGTEYVVPVWDLRDGEGNSWQVLGLAEEALDFTP